MNLGKEDNLPREREEKAREISITDVHRSVMQNILNLDVTIDAKGNLLISTIPDLSFILCELRKWKENDFLSNPDYYNLVECALLNNLNTYSHETSYEFQTSENSSYDSSYDGSDDGSNDSSDDSSDD